MASIFGFPPSIMGAPAAAAPGINPASNKPKTATVNPFGAPPFHSAAQQQQQQQPHQQAKQGQQQQQRLSLQSAVLGELAGNYVNKYIFPKQNLQQQQQQHQDEIVCCCLTGAATGGVAALQFFRVLQQSSSSTRGHSRSTVRIGCYLLQQQQQELCEAGTFEVHVPGHDVEEEGLFKFICCSSSGKAIALCCSRACCVSAVPLLQQKQQATAKSRSNGTGDCCETIGQLLLANNSMEPGQPKQQQQQQRSFLQVSFHPFSNSAVAVLTHESLASEAAAAASAAAADCSDVHAVLRLFEICRSTEKPEQEILLPAAGAPAVAAAAFPAAPAAAHPGHLASAFQFGAAAERIHLWTALSVFISYPPGSSSSSSRSCVCLSPFLPAHSQLPPALALQLHDAALQQQLQQQQHTRTNSCSSGEADDKEQDDCPTGTLLQQEVSLWLKDWASGSSTAKGRNSKSGNSNMQAEPQLLLLPLPQGSPPAQPQQMAEVLIGTYPLLLMLRCSSSNNNLELECLASSDTVQPRLQRRAPLVQQKQQQQQRQTQQQLPKLLSFVPLATAKGPVASSSTPLQLRPLPAVASSNSNSCAALCCSSGAFRISVTGIFAAVQQRLQQQQQRQPQQKEDAISLCVKALTTNTRRPLKFLPPFSWFVSAPNVLVALASGTTAATAAAEPASTSTEAAAARAPDAASLLVLDLEAASGLEPLPGCRNSIPASEQQQQQQQQKQQQLQQHKCHMSEQASAALNSAYQQQRQGLLELRQRRAAAAKAAAEAAAAETADPTSSNRKARRAAAAAAAEVAVAAVKWIDTAESTFLKEERQQMVLLQRTVPKMLRCRAAMLQQQLLLQADEAERMQQQQKKQQQKLSDLERQSEELKRRCSSVAALLAAAAASLRRRQLAVSLPQHALLLQLLPSQLLSLVSPALLHHERPTDVSPLVRLTAAVTAQMLAIQQREQKLQQEIFCFDSLQGTPSNQ
ncbi:armadillo/beta-catenin-like repeat-containing protein, putative [Eimeria tenella]|uniref:Armadillo/beta-catenin-like repeat-containing protein, putative n=1 Tax=Eimeria tenella TaxID=5802 RepID=U6KRH5_EIMTE|nr:armadillo/beta-catenin-like repeat-containing protein, putative [Eimeria tenella]CDJ38944.1 armadillo/beta-catenin-like repeat-containing protein, putative [Eimeria tenella]|eukprot:XP_013229699.1 armadillo/beta-catenin-like repeat-containing protein, putative [Eimeria tenella]